MNILNKIFLVVVPLVNTRSPLTFYYDVSNTLHNFFSPVLACLILYNGISNKYDIFYYKFSSRFVKHELSMLHSLP